MKNESSVSGSQKQANHQEYAGLLTNYLAAVSKSTRRLFMAYTVFLAYCLLSVISVSDRQMALGSPLSLPLLNVEVSLTGFFVAAPVLVIMLFIYLQLNILRGERLAAYLKIQVDPANKWRLWSWPARMARIPGAEIPDKIIGMTANAFLWSALPLALIFIAFLFIKKHEPVWSYVVGSMPILGTAAVLVFWRLVSSSSWRKSRARTLLRSGGLAIIMAVELFLLFFLIPWANNGLSAKTVNMVSDRIRPLFCLDLSHQQLVKEPIIDHEGQNWGDFRDAHLEGAILRNAVLKRANLRGADLMHARMEQAVLIKADLRYSNLAGAQLWHSDFRGADMAGVELRSAYAYETQLPKANLWNASLIGCRLYYANLEEADLTLADCEAADLWGANLRNACLFQANLQDADLSSADLSSADLEEANLKGAILWNTNLQGVKNLNIEQLAQARTLFQAKLDPELRKKVEEEYPHLLKKSSSQ